MYLIAAWAISSISIAKFILRALGTAKPGEGGLDQYRRINFTYLQRGLETFGTKLAPQVSGGAKFRFAYVGGAFSVNDSGKKQNLWVLGDARRVRVRILSPLPDSMWRKDGVIPFCSTGSFRIKLIFRRVKARP
jgi:hypothetical protein